MFSSNMGYLFHNSKYFFYYYLSSEKLYIRVISSLKTSNYNSQLNIHQIFVVFLLFLKYLMLLRMSTSILIISKENHIHFPNTRNILKKYALKNWLNKFMMN